MRNAEMTALIRASLPILQAEGESFTRLFYHKLLSKYPELQHLFNPAHQAQGMQQRSLATALYAYAANIDHPAPLKDAIAVIANKHVALGVRAEHYPLVGQTLLASLQEWLGDRASPTLLEAWALAYQQLTEQLIQIEATLYQRQFQRFGWQGFKPVVVIDKQSESRDICSLSMGNIDGLPLAAHLPGQYITLKFSQLAAPIMLRHYSISNAPAEGYYRISVRRQIAEGQPDGRVSHYLHDVVQSGDAILMAPPSGDFVLNTAEQPLLLIAGGIGITPLLSMLYASLRDQPGRSVTLIQSVRHWQDLPFEAELSRLAAAHSQFHWHVCLTGDRASRQIRGATLSTQRLDAQLINQLSGRQAVAVYACGPLGLLQRLRGIIDSRAVTGDRLMTEQFGPAS